METPDRLTDAESDPQRTLVLIGLGYLGLVVVAFWLDHKIQMRRARKRREARESGFTERERSRFRKDDDEPPRRT